MSDNPLIGPIEGYQIAVAKADDCDIIAVLPLKLSKVGGAHITNAESLIMMIEDAVFSNEEKENDT